MFSTLRLYLYGGIAVALLSAGLALYVKGRADGSNKAYIDALEQTVKDFQLWDQADADVKDLSDYQRCIELGGLHDDCAELVRNQETTEGEQPGTPGR